MTNIYARCRVGLAATLRSRSPRIAIDEKGYVGHPEENLLENVKLADFRSDFEEGDGQELKDRFLAAHSSSALTANCFGPFKTRPNDLQLLADARFDEVAFERKFPTGLRGGRSPNLDVVAKRPDRVIAIESKCTEYLSPHRTHFSNAYSEQIRDSRRLEPWFAEMERLQNRPDHFVHLDAAQLIKHAFGLGRAFSGKPVTLLYLFWEPKNPGADEAFKRHREEIQDFRDRVSGGHPRFAWSSYPELWDTWSSSHTPDWLPAHIEQLRGRYLRSL